MNKYEHILHDPRYRRLLKASVKRALASDFYSNGNTNRVRKRLLRSAENLGKIVRANKVQYEMFLYQAIGRKVDFEETSVEPNSGAQCNVTVKFIVQKDTTEPQAPRLCLNFSVVPNETQEDPDAVKITLNSGFINAIGMHQVKFTQEDFEEQKIEDPAHTFGWIQYLEGDFLKAKRVVKPFGGGEADMGLKDPTAQKVAFLYMNDMLKEEF